MAGLDNFNQPDYGLRGIQGEEKAIGFGTPKGTGFFGILPMQDGSNREATEMSVHFNYDNKDALVPLINPTLNQNELSHLLKGGEPTDEMIEKTRQWGLQRLQQGRSPFLDEADRVQQGLANYKGN